MEAGRTPNFEIKNSNNTQDKTLWLEQCQKHQQNNTSKLASRAGSDATFTAEEGTAPQS
jgi:hypothetical protein